MIDGMPDVTAEEWFCVKVHNNWSIDRDNFLAQAGKDVWVEFRPDRDKLVPKQLTQGILGVSRTFPAGGGSFTAACTVTPREKTLDVKA